MQERRRKTGRENKWNWQKQTNTHRLFNGRNERHLPNYWNWSRLPILKRRIKRRKRESGKRTHFPAVRIPGEHKSRKCVRILYVCTSSLSPSLLLCRMCQKDVGRVWNVSSRECLCPMYVAYRVCVKHFRQAHVMRQVCVELLCRPPCKKKKEEVFTFLFSLLVCVYRRCSRYAES